MKYYLTILLLLGNFIISKSTPFKTSGNGYVLDLHFEVPVIKATRIYKNEIELLARLIECESGNQELNGRIAVGNVVLNRARIKNQSIKKIIYHRDKSGRPQFDGIDTKYFHRNPSKLSWEAAKKAFDTKIVPDSVYYFYNPNTSTDSKWIRLLESNNLVYKDIGDHRFCYYNK